MKEILICALIFGALIFFVLLRDATRLLKKFPIREYYERARRVKNYVPLEKIPPEVAKIFVGCEDPMFYEHHGVDFKEIFRAFVQNIRKRQFIYGGSTITQQLIKNIYFAFDRSFRRKLVEMFIALYIELRGLLSKDEILELYLNCVQMGPYVFGLAEAAHYYFRKTADKLTLNQAIILATVLPSPRWRRPIEMPLFFSLKRRNKLIWLVLIKYLTLEEAKKIDKNYGMKNFDSELRSKEEISARNPAPTNSGLVEFARGQVGAAYWWGTFGQVATPGLFNYCRMNYPQKFSDLSYLDDLGKRVFDCSGLIKGYLWFNENLGGSRHDKKTDWSAHMFYEKSERRGSIEIFDFVHGRLLYVGDTPENISHVGIYSEEGLVYQAKGHEFGVVAIPFRQEDWNFWSQCPLIPE